MTYRFHFAMNDKTAERNQEMFDLHRKGHSCAAIARLFGLSQSRVWSIIANGASFSTTPLSEVYS